MTRRERNEQFGRSSPEVEVPDAGEYLWEWYHDISDRMQRVIDGVCHPIPPSEWLAWQQLTGNIVYRWEFAILTAMDSAYHRTLNTELSAAQNAKIAEAEDKAKKGGRR